MDCNGCQWRSVGNERVCNKCKTTGIEKPYVTPPPAPFGIGPIKNKKKSKKLLTTPRSKVRSALRHLWLRSRERAAALKRDGYTCQKCSRKQSKAKGREFAVQVHHKHGVVNWEQVIDYVMESLLCGPEQLETLCEECHGKEEGHGH